ncbi:MAG: hypothetical protein QQW96_17970 [Tychonema bourrellyi B0820]|nr:hypothetical protein [Tychonema bourrellyi B0820]
MGHGAWGHGALGIGHGELGMGNWAWELVRILDCSSPNRQR